MKRILRLVLIALVVAAGALAGFFLGFVWWRTWNPAFDYGPYTGVPHATPNIKAAQEFPLWAGRHLAVYPRAEGDLAPVVVLKESGNRVMWSIEARGRDGCQVNSLRFDAYSTLPWIWPRVVGLVDWNCGGRERLEARSRRSSQGVPVLVVGHGCRSGWAWQSGARLVARPRAGQPQR